MFLEKSDIFSEPVPMGLNEFFSHPSSEIGAPTEDLIFVRGTLDPGTGHDFHLHTDREEFIYVLSGTIEQWVGTEKKICTAGDVIYVGHGKVHGSFNVGDGTAQILAIFNNKYAKADLTTDVSQQDPWESLRPAKN